MKPRSTFLAAVLLSGPAIAGEKDIAIVVDRVFNSSGPFVHVLARVTNKLSDPIGRIEVRCDVFDAEDKALGTGDQTVREVGPGSTVVADLLVRKPPEAPPPNRAVCRVIPE